MHHAPPRAPDVVVFGVRFKQPLGQALDTGTGADRINPVNRRMIELSFDHRLQVTTQGFGHPDTVFARHRLAQATANAESLLDNGIQAFSRRRFIAHDLFSS